MPRGKYIINQKQRAAMRRSLGGKEPKQELHIPLGQVFRVPRNLRGIENQAKREELMYKFLDKLPDSEIKRVLKSYGELEKTDDGETFTQVAAAINMKRAMNKKKK